MRILLEVCIHNLTRVAFLYIICDFLVKFFVTKNDHKHVFKVCIHNLTRKTQILNDMAPITEYLWLSCEAFGHKKWSREYYQQSAFIIWDGVLYYRVFLYFLMKLFVVKNDHKYSHRKPIDKELNLKLWTQNLSP